MEKFTTLEGVAAPLKIINVDTDMIIPKQYLKAIKRTGLGKGLFSEQRYKDDGSENPDFILNIKFEIDPFRKHCLMNGLDDIGLTMEKKPSIDAYEAKLKECAWA